MSSISIKQQSSSPLYWTAYCRDQRLSFIPKRTQTKTSVEYANHIQSPLSEREASKKGPSPAMYFLKAHLSLLRSDGTPLSCQHTRPQQTFIPSCKCTQSKEQLGKVKDYCGPCRQHLCDFHPSCVRGFVNALMERAACVLSRARRPGFT